MTKIIQHPLIKYPAGAMMLGVLTIGMLYPHIPLAIGGIDKLVHWSAFFLLGIALLGPLSFTKSITIGTLLVLSFALEGGQLFVAERHADIADCAANIFGVGCAISAVQLAPRLRGQKAS